MALSDKLEMLKATKTRVTGECSYSVLYNNLEEEDKKALDDAWAKGYSVNIILSALRSDGHKSSNESIRAHRSGTCRCPKE
tara:strand:+ start:456 stop:698 length:243 start_codon:yes stop_codon:yes gene_type:complete